MSEGKENRKRAKVPTRLLLDSYRPLPGVPDEMVDANGNARPIWAGFIAALEELGPQELSKRFARADQYLRDAGVYYRVYDNVGTNEREWPLSHIPLLIDETEWATISAGLIQRADLFESHRRRHLRRQPACPAGLAAAWLDRIQPRIFAARWQA